MSSVHKALAFFERTLGARLGDRGFPLAVACAVVAILTPTFALIKTLLGGHVQHLGWLILTPVFAMLAKLLAGIDWLHSRKPMRALLVGAILVAATLETIYLGHLLGVSLGI